MLPSTAGALSGTSRCFHPNNFSLPSLADAEIYNPLSVRQDCDSPRKLYVRKATSSSKRQTVSSQRPERRSAKRSPSKFRKGLAAAGRSSEHTRSVGLSVHSSSQATCRLQYAAAGTYGSMPTRTLSNRHATKGHHGHPSSNNYKTSASP